VSLDSLCLDRKYQISITIIHSNISTIVDQSGKMTSMESEQLEFQINHNQKVVWINQSKIEPDNSCFNLPLILCSMLCENISQR